MTEEKDGPVHYQVSVTGRQAAAFFLVLLAALGLSFFFGMKTGAAAKRGPDAVTALAAQSDIAVPSGKGDGEAGESTTPVPTEVPLGFDSAPARETAGKPAPAAKEEAPSKSEPPVKEEPKPVVRELAPPTPPRPTAAPAAQKATPAPKAAEKPAEKAASAKEEGPFWVQILVTKSAEKADDLARKLKTDGFRSDVSLVPEKKGLFRVRVGPYPDQAKAEAAAKKVETAEKLQTKPIVVPGK